MGSRLRDPIRRMTTSIDLTWLFHHSSSIIPFGYLLFIKAIIVHINSLLIDAYLV